MSKTVFVRGAAQTRFGELWDKGLIALMCEATQGACDDALISKDQIDYIVVGNMSAESMTTQGNLGALLADYLQLSVSAVRVEGACASGGVAVATAYDIIRAGRASHVLVVGAEKMTDQPSNEISSYLMHASDSLYDYPTGLTFAGSCALIARYYADRYSVPLEKLCYPSVKSHSAARANSFAHFSHPVTLEQVMHAPMVADPLTLLQCAPISDGAAALILSSQPTDKSINIAAACIATDTVSLTRRKVFDTFTATQQATKQALHEAKVVLKDIDVFEVHDGFSIVEVITMEDLGLCKKGEGADFIMEGHTLTSGKYPVNVMGGLKAGGHPIGATGVRQIVTLTQLLRNETLGYQTGLAQNIGGIGSVVTVHILRR